MVSSPMSSKLLSMEYLEPLEQDPTNEEIEGFKDSGKSAEEIAQFSVDESIPELERAVMFVEKGVPVQRLSVVNNLEYLVKQFGDEARTKLVPRVCAVLPDLEREIQHSASLVFRDLVERDLLPADLTSRDLLPRALKVLARDDEEVVAEWLATVTVMLPLLPGDVLSQEVTPFAMEMGGVTKGIVSRLLACRLLGALCTRLSSTQIETTFFNQAMALCQDTDFDVRVCMCEQLPAIAAGIGHDLTRRVLFAELVELLRDEESTVRAQAVRSAVAMIPALDDAGKRDLVLPLAQGFIRDAREDVSDVVAETFGAMIHSLREILSEDEAAEFYEFFKALAAREEPALRHWAAYNFPAVLASMGVARYAIHIHPVLLRLAADPDADVRASVAAGIHEVCRMLGAERCAKFLRDPLTSLLRDVDARVPRELVPNLALTLSLFKTSEGDPPTVVPRSYVYNDVLPALLHFAAAVRGNWRDYLALLEQWRDLPSYLTGDQIVEHIFPLLFDALAESPYPVKDEAARLIAAFVRRNRVASRRAELCTVLIADFAESTGCHMRLVFLDVCRVFLEMFSRRFFRAHFLEVCLDLAEDPVPNVRRKLCVLLPAIKRTIRPEDRELYDTLRDRTAILMTDKDPEVHKLALESAKELSRIQAARRSAPGSRGPRGAAPGEDDRDAAKEAEENDLVAREQVDAEQNKRRLEQMADRARSEYKQKLTDPRLAKDKGSTRAMGRRSSVVAAPLAEAKKQQLSAAAAAGHPGSSKSATHLATSSAAGPSPSSGFLAPNSGHSVSESSLTAKRSLSPSTLHPSSAAGLSPAVSPRDIHGGPGGAKRHGGSLGPLNHQQGRRRASVSVPPSAAHPNPSRPSRVLSASPTHDAVHGSSGKPQRTRSMTPTAGQGNPAMAPSGTGSGGGADGRSRSRRASATLGYIPRTGAIAARTGELGSAREAPVAPQRRKSAAGLKLTPIGTLGGKSGPSSSSSSVSSSSSKSSSGTRAKSASKAGSSAHGQATTATSAPSSSSSSSSSNASSKRLPPRSSAPGGVVRKR